MAKNALSANKNSEKRLKGLATIKVKEDKVRITFQDEEVTFDNGKNSKTFDVGDLPKTPRLEDGSNETYFVVMNAEGDEVESIGPEDGVFDAVCVAFNRESEDDDPKPIEGSSKKHPEWPPYQYFLAFFEIQKGPFKKTRIPYFLQYKFEENRDKPGEAAWKGDPENSKATRLQQLIEFCLMMDIVGEPIEWPEDGNILPVLLDRVLANKKLVKIVVKKGNISELLNAHKEEVEETDEDDEAEEEAPKSKRPSKSKKDEEEDDDL